MKTYNLAVLGCGGISKAHLTAIKEIPEIKPFVMVDVVEERAREAAKEAGAKHALTDWRKAVAMEEVDIVDICLPHTLHKNPALEAARRAMTTGEVVDVAPCKEIEMALRAKVRNGVFAFLTLAGVMVCGTAQNAAGQDVPAATQAIVLHTAELARGTMNGVEAAEDGSIVLARKNFLRNSSFEWDDYEGRGIRDGLAADWGLWGKGYGTYSDKSVPYLPNDATHGARSQRLELTAEGKEPLVLVQTARNLKANLPYTFSADVKVDDPKEVVVSLNLQFYTGEKWHSQKSGEWAAPTQFTRMSVTGILPEGANNVRALVVLRPERENARGTLWVDAAQLEQSDNASPYKAAHDYGPAEYVSPPLDASRFGPAHKFTWIACQPASTDIRFHLRSAKSEAELAAAPWLGPTKADAYSARIETGDNLIANPSVEQDADNDGQPDAARTIGYGENDRSFAVVDDAFDGKKALKVEIKEHKGGDGRWHVPTQGAIEKDTEYMFSVRHKENSPVTPIRLSVTFEDASGKMHWGQFGDTREASVAWKEDSLYFRTPKDMDIKRVWGQVSLAGAGWIISDCYSLRRVVGEEEWAVNPAQQGGSWLQFRALFKTFDSYYTPKLYRAELRCGPSTPEVRWLNALSEQGDRQKYSFNPGQTVLFKPQILDFAGQANIENVELVLRDPAGRERHKATLARAEVLSDVEAVFAGQYTFGADAALGEWQATATAAGKGGRSCRETVLLKVRQPYTRAPQRMIVGALVDDYGFSRFKGEPLQQLIEKYKLCAGLEIWKLSLAWKRLEQVPGKFDEEMVAGLRTFIAAAHAAGAKAQIGIQQQNFPDWVNNGDWDNRNRYRYEQTKRLTDTWARLVAALKDCAGLESYLLINEENHVHDADAYLRSLTKVASAVRQVDPDLSHRITIRPNTRAPFPRTRIASDGSQDYDYGSGGYPTSSSWYFKKYASPVSPTSYLRMAYLHDSPFVFGGPGGIGEIGFFRRPPKDAFGDEERLAGFQRAMRIAYELGMDEFQLWGGGFSFDKLEVYFPKLIEFRNELVKQPRPTNLDVRLVVAAEDRMYVGTPPASSELDMTAQPFAPAIRFLDEKGYTWFHTSPEAMAIQSVGATATINLSDLKGKNAGEQEQFLAEALRGVKPSGIVLPWPRE